MRLLLDIVAKQWVENNREHPRARWLNTCWQMYKRLPGDEPSRVMLQGAIDDVIILSGGIVMVKIDSPVEQVWLKGNGGV